MKILKVPIPNLQLCSPIAELNLWGPFCAPIRQPIFPCTHVEVHHTHISTHALAYPRLHFLGLHVGNLTWTGDGIIHSYIWMF